MFGINNPEAWLFHADGSYIATRLLWFSHFMIEAPVNSHHTIELYLKTYLVSSGATIKKGQRSWGHDLVQLTKACSNYSIDFSTPELVRRIAFYQRYHELVRYPSEIEGALQDGSLIWFSFDSAILPLDEVVAFVRPRIHLSNECWKNSRLNMLSREEKPEWSLQQRALKNTNNYINQINCDHTHHTQIKFDSHFKLDLPGC